MKTYDLTIIGGGLVGAALALGLRGSGLKIAAVEQVARAAALQPSYDERTLVLNQVSRQALEGMGLWPAIAPNAHPIRRIHVSDRGRFGRVLLAAEDHGLAAFGYVVAAHRLGAVMVPALAAMADLDQYCPAQLVGLTPGGRAVEVELDNARFTSRLVVGADGAGSAVRRLLGIAAEQYDYRQTAIIANLSTERPHGDTAYERFTTTGPLALLPHGPGRLGLVWTVASEEAPAALDLDDAAALSVLQARFGHRLGRLTRIGKRQAYPLKLLHATRPLAERAVLIGNAAHTIHPISAQGFNLGLRDAVALAAHLAGAPDPGAAALLASYQQSREPDQRATIRYTDTLVRLFRNDTPGFRLLRSASLVAHQWLPAVQRRLVVGALGYRGMLDTQP